MNDRHKMSLQTLCRGRQKVARPENLGLGHPIVIQELLVTDQDVVVLAWCGLFTFFFFQDITKKD